MWRLVDYHTHTNFSDGKGTIDEMVHVAIKKGLFELGFSDHFCAKNVNWAMADEDVQVYVNQVIEAQKKYQDKITIKLGLEMDYLPGKEKETARTIESIPLDYVIGSVHFIGDWNFDTDKSLYGKWTNDELYFTYFGLIQDLAKSKLFDVIGHLDIIKKFNVYPESDLTHLFENTIRIIAEAGCVVELNTGGLDRPCADFTPSKNLLNLCFKHNVKVTLSSDAHKPSQIARHYDTAIRLLKEIGYDSIVTFNKREQSFLTI